MSLKESSPKDLPTISIRCGVEGPSTLGGTILREVTRSQLDCPPSEGPSQECFVGQFPRDSPESPILNLSLALNYAWGGTAVTGYHVVNALIHLLAGLILFGIVRRTVQAGPQPAWLARVDPTVPALAVALLWTLHPLQTEAVTYVVQRAESLMGLFYLFTLYGLIRYAATGRTRWAVASVAACLLGDGTKEILVTAPVMLLVFDRTFLAGSYAGAWKLRRTYYLALALTWIPLAFLVVGTGGNRAGSSGFGAGISWSGYVLTQFEALSRYLELSVWPHPLVFDYGPFQTTLAAALPFALFIGVLAGGTLYAMAQKPVLGFFGFWFFGILAVTSLIPGSSEMLVERRMYLPLAAIVVLFVLGLLRWTGKAAVPIALAAAVVLGALTWSRNTVYASDVAIWRDGLSVRPLNSRGEYNLGVAYYKHDQPDLEIAAYREAVRLDPANSRAHHSLANALVQAGRPAEAMADYELAVAQDPTNAETHCDFGTAEAALGRTSEAAEQFRRALALNPALVAAHDNLGVALARLGDLPQAIEPFQRAVELTPARATAHVNLGGALATLNRLAEAEAQLRQAVSLEPSLGLARANLGNVLCQEGRFADAVPEFTAALRLAPGDLAVQQNLGTAYLETGNASAALPLFTALVQAEPRSAEAHHNLAAALAALGRTGEAENELRTEARLSGQ